MLRSEGVKTVLVALMAEKAEVRYDPAYIMPSQIASKVTALGYVASVLDSEQDGRASIEVQVSCRTYRMPLEYSPQFTFRLNRLHVYSSV